jgi:PAS domain S-box-containing protein
MSLKQTLLDKKNNTFHIKFLIVSTIFLMLISFGIYRIYSEKNEKTLTNAQEEKEQLIVHQLTSFLDNGFGNNKNENVNKSIEKIVNAAGVHYILISGQNDSVLVEINHSGGRDSSEINDQAIVYDKNDIFKYTQSIETKNSQIFKLTCDFSRSDLNWNIEKANTEIGMICFFIFTISFIALFIGSLVIMLPLQKISNSVVEISSGNLAKRIKQKKRNEFSGIASSVNVLAENLQKANSQVEKLNKELKFQFRDKIGELNYEINQRRQAEHSLRQSEEQFKLLFELAPIGMVISSLYGEILKVNASFHTALGYTEEEIIGTKIKELTYSEDRSLDVKLHEKLLNNLLQNAYYEKRLVRKDGEIIYVIVEAVMVKNKEGKPSHIIEQVINITERKKVEKELIFAKEKAEESDRLKSAFLAQMSHEIRTPLNVILTAMNLIQDDFNDKDEDTKELLDSVSSAGKRLQRTIDLILNISAVQSGSYAYDIKDFDLNKELTVLIEEFKTIANEKGLEISYTNRTTQSMILADQYSVTQIFQNLIANAIKYTPKGSVAVILEEWNQEKFQVQVTDTGIGISKEYISKLFSPFSQEDVGHKREFEGNGLGLALVKKYVEMNNADILVESEKDIGSTFKVIFNKKQLNSTVPQKKVLIKPDDVTALV